MTAEDEGKPPDGARSEYQNLADRDQWSANLDQGEADLDQSASDIDQGAADRDQRASERDQATADHDERSSAGQANTARFERSRQARKESTNDRVLSTQTRSESSRIRDDAAMRRDRNSADRDDAAGARDQLAAALYADVDRLRVSSQSEEPMDPGLRAAIDRKRATESRTRAARQRDASIRDREMAAKDRRLAAADREAAAKELSLQGVDNLTGTLRRGTGLDGIRRELDRTARSGEDLVVAFIDIDGLKQINDTHDHAAGDALLREVSLTIQRYLRSYDLILRFGGDEFVCSLAGQDAAGARERFERVSADLRETSDATISVGIAERREGETVEDLIRRADNAMIDARQRR